MKRASRLAFFTLCLAGTANVLAVDLEAGKKLFTGRCVECHGVDALGLEAQEAPRLAGQYDWYIVSQIKNFKAGVRKNPKMMPFISDLTESQMADIAAYIQQFKAEAPAAATEEVKAP